MTQQRPDERRAAELSRLMAAYEKDILKLCCLYLRDAGMAEDAAQETFFKAYRALDRFRGECADKTWLVRIFINECYDIHRRRAREAPREIPERAAPPGADRELHDALMRLPEEVRTPIVLHYMEGYSVEEIASALRLAQGTVKSRMRRGRAMLKELLSEEEGL